MDASHLRQATNNAQGNIAGNDYAERDINHTTILPAPKSETALARLYRKLKTEAEDNPSLIGYIRDLEIYTRTIENEEVIGLEQKLSVAGRHKQFEVAKRQKEAMFAELSRNQFSVTFQRIYATLMAKVFEEFETWIRPAINSGTEPSEIDKLVHVHIVKPIVQEMEDCEYYEGVAIATVRGMIYFLTGNCHICWH